MVTELQFVAVAAFLIWGLAASLCGVLAAAPDAARLVRRHGDVEPEAPLPEPDQPAGIFMSNHIAVAADNPSQEAQST